MPVYHLSDLADGKGHDQDIGGRLPHRLGYQTARKGEIAEYGLPFEIDLVPYFVILEQVQLYSSFQEDMGTLHGFVVPEEKVPVGHFRYRTVVDHPLQLVQ